MKLTKRPKRQEQLRAEWAAHLEQQKQSGKNIRAYCERNGLKVWQFHYYNRVLKKSASADEPRFESGFEPLLPCAGGTLCLEVSGCRLVIERPIDPELLRQVVAILKAS